MYITMMRYLHDPKHYNLITTVGCILGVGIFVIGFTLTFTLGSTPANHTLDGCVPWLPPATLIADRLCTHGCNVTITALFVKPCYTNLAVLWDSQEHFYHTLGLWIDEIVHLCPEPVIINKSECGMAGQYGRRLHMYSAISNSSNCPEACF
jgi:hypothetical protein